MVTPNLSSLKILQDSSLHQHEITRNIRADQGNINEERIRRQIEEIKDEMNPSLDPRAKMHLDSTKIFYPQHRERLIAWSKGELVAPITIDMALTQKCSFSCTYCYAGLQYNEASPANWETYKNLLDDFASIGHRSGQGVKGVSLVSDGESTENPFFHDFILYGKSKGIDMASGTNGYLLDPKKYFELLPALTYLRFNISAGEKEAYKKIMGVGEKQWSRTLENIREAVRVKKINNLQTTIGLQMVLLPEYADQVIPLAKLGKELGVDYTVIKHCSDDEKGSLGVDYSWYHSSLARDVLVAAESLSTEDYSVQVKWSKILTGRDRKYSKCFGTPLLFQMSGTGIVAPCGSFFGNDYEKYHIGNYTQHRFKDVWASSRYKTVTDFLASDKFNPQHMCATLCLQDKVNEALYDWVIDKHADLSVLPDYSDRPIPLHLNFI